jgi:cytosine/adenosine deaminase-related metal-dependent hydrolase
MNGIGPPTSSDHRESVGVALHVLPAPHVLSADRLGLPTSSDHRESVGVALHVHSACPFYPLLVEAGFTPMEALQCATIKPAKFLGKLDSLGTIEKGKIADLVLLDANPLEDISHTRKINSVIIGGKLVPISKLRDQFLNPAVAR